MSLMHTTYDLTSGRRTQDRHLTAVPGSIPVADPSLPGRAVAEWPAGIFDSLPVTICIVELDGRIRHVNSGVRGLLGWEPAECEGLAAIDFLHPADRSRATSWFKRLREGRSAGTLLCQLLHHREEPPTVEISCGRLERDPDGALVFVVRMIERRSPVTAVVHGDSASPSGMVDRESFARAVNKLVPGASDQALVLFVDIDDYDGIVHAYGANAATELVDTVRDVMSACVRRHDLVGWLGSGSLAVLFRDVPDRDVTKLVRRLSRALQRPVSTTAGRIRLSASVGAARPECRLESPARMCS
jgi:diguanylate cyclase (GGDEF)-like protein